MILIIKDKMAEIEMSQLENVSLLVENDKNYKALSILFPPFYTLSELCSFEMET